MMKVLPLPSLKVYVVFERVAVVRATPTLLRGTLEVYEFVNADLIAQGLSGFQPEGAVFHAGRVMIERIHYLAKRRVDFAFETTLASRAFAPWIKELLDTGYIFHLVFLWLPDQEFLVNDSAIWHNIKENYDSKRKTKRQSR
jgi:predicted ABC-type ATPase